MTYTVSSGTLNPSIPYHTRFSKIKYIGAVFGVSDGGCETWSKCDDYDDDDDGGGLT